MSVTVAHNHYGKINVKLVKVFRYPDRHEIKDIIVNILLEGDFDSSYSEGDNSKVLPTDTMKNTVYAIAADHNLNSIEEYGSDLAKHLLENNSQISGVTVDIIENNWERISVDGKPHHHSFISSGKGKRKTKISAKKNVIEIRSGLDDISILKTADSGFESYIKDKFTTLKETNDRIFATKLSTQWLYTDNNIDFVEMSDFIRNVLLKTFTEHNSLSVQHTLHAMGKEALEKCDKISEITMTMPNVHNIPVNLELFGLKNKNEIFVATVEPFGFIEATLKR